MTERDSKYEELSTVSTNADSPRQENSEFHPLSLNLMAKQTSSKDNDKNKEYEQKIEKLSSYVIKLKKALEQQNFKVAEQTKEIDALKQHNGELESLVTKFVNEEQTNDIDVEKIKKVSCKIKVDAVNWLCLKFDDKVEWHREESLKEKLAGINAVLPPEFDPIVELERKKQDEKKMKELKDQLDRVISQYESRVVYMQQQLDLTEDKLRNTLQETKKQSEEQGNKIGEMAEHIVTLLDQSSDIRESSLMSFNEESDASMKSEATSKMKLLLAQLQKQKFDSDQAAMNNLKNHLLMLHQTLYDLLKKLATTNVEIVTLEKRWKKKCESIFIEKENEKKEKTEIVEVGRKKIKELEEVIENLKSHCSKETKERDFKIDFLTKEVKKNANLEYIRNILINFMTNKDYTVREGLLPVLATVLQFSPSDLETVKSVWEKEHNSLIAKGGSKVTNLLSIFGK